MKQIQHYKNKLHDIGRAGAIIAALAFILWQFIKANKLQYVFIFFAMIVLLTLILFRVI